MGNLLEDGGLGSTYGTNPRAEKQQGLSPLPKPAREGRVGPGGLSPSTSSLLLCAHTDGLFLVPRWKMAIAICF